MVGDIEVGFGIGNRFVSNMQAVVISDSVNHFEIYFCRVAFFTIRTCVVHFQAISELFYFKEFTAKTFFTTVQ